ncbi:LuxR C-terminal-related transcriptional regulator [Angustibacter sp. McL0619]|uniref:LuxR C-terminal-related transcriptional regulator n=1 Tax=Angustibacter sp. McL0619 TaxID=3415676 RepID=UPI003CE7315A
MVGPLLDSKTNVPGRRPGTLARPRLGRRLGTSATSAITLVSAPAGFGKTTLLMQWLADLPAPAPGLAWVSLDQGDDEPTLFWMYVITALRARVEGLGAGALALLQSRPPRTEAALTVLLNELQAHDGELVLVLDDYHVIDSQEIHDGMAFLLDHLPAQVHLVIATRADPPLPLARHRVRGHLVEIRSADLRFTEQEAAEYLSGPMGLALNGSDVAMLAERTEGWIAALQLAGLSMQDRGDASAFIAGFAGDDRYVVDYLAEEVLARQPVDLREFLLTTSILDRLCGSLCEAVTGQSGGRARLESLERANLFVVPLDDRRQWYRYHHLFADVLRAHLLEDDASRLAELHLRASRWFEAAGQTSPAINHALSAGDVGRAADLMELAMPAMQQGRREAELARWVRVLPDEVVQVRPVLGVAFVGVLAQVSQFDSVAERLSGIERSVRSDDGTWFAQPPPGLVVVDQEAYRSVPAAVELYRAALALAHGDLTGTVTRAREALSLAPPHGDLVRASAGALAGLASWANGDLAAAHAAYTESVAGLRNVGFLADVLGCTITLGDICCTQGRLPDAVRTYQQALDLAARESGGGEPLRGTADMHVGLAGVLLEQDDVAAAAEHLAVSDRLGEHNGLPQNPYRRRVVEARLREVEGDLDAALALLDEANRVYDGDYSPNVRPVPAMRARLLLRRGELGQAAAWAGERQLSADDELSYLREYEHVTLVRLLIARHRGERDDAALDDALRLLRRLLAAAEAGGRGGTVIELLVLLALAEHGRGETSAALAALDRGVDLAQPPGYVRVFADEGAPMAALLRKLTKQASARGHLRRLQASTAGTEPSPFGPTTLVDPLSERELDVLRLLGTDLGGPDIARALSVSLNTMRTHTKSIYTKLGVTSRRDAVRQAQALDLLPGRRPS